MVVFAIVAGFLIFLLVAHWYGDPVYRVLGCVALIGHIILALVVLPFLPYGWDIGNFHDAAVVMLGGGYATASSTVATFGTIQAILYAIFSVDTTVVSITNSLLAVLVPIPVLYLVHQLYGDVVRYEYGVVTLVLFLPAPYLFLTIPMREAATVFLIFVQLALIARSIVREDVLVGLVTLPVFALIYLLRPEWGLLLLLGMLAGIGVKLLEKVKVDFSLSTAAVLIGGIGAIGFGLFAEVMYSLERANAALSWRAQGGAVYLEGMQYNSWFDVILAAPGRAFYFQFAPFPLHVDSVFHALGLVSVAYIVVFTVAAVRSMYSCEANHVVLVTLLVVYLAGITGYGLINSNFGTNIRHRIPFVFLLLVFASPVIQRWELLVRRWFGVGPDEDDEYDGQQREAQELDGHVESG